VFAIHAIALATATSGVVTDPNRPLSEFEKAYIRAAVGGRTPGCDWHEVAKWGPRAKPELLAIATGAKVEDHERGRALWTVQSMRRPGDVSAFADAAAKAMPTSKLSWAGAGLRLIERANKPSHGPAVCDYMLRVMAETDGERHHLRGQPGPHHADARGGGRS